jgi:hypothetical protein
MCTPFRVSRRGVIFHGAISSQQTLSSLHSLVDLAARKAAERLVVRWQAFSDEKDRVASFEESEDPQMGPETNARGHGEGWPFPATGAS